MKPSRDIPDDLLGVAETLESNRPQLSGLDADRIKRRAMAQGARTPTHTSTKGLFMRSRLAITSMLALGLLMTSGGAALGVEALSTSESASVAQYGGNTEVLDDTAEGGEDDSDVAGDTEEGGSGSGTLGDTGPGGQVAGDTVEGGGDAPLAAAQSSRQLESGTGSDSGGLPFTGYAAVPTLLIGIGLLAMGLVLRRNAGGATARS